MNEINLDFELTSMIDRLIRFFREDKIRFPEFASNVIFQLWGKTATNIDAVLQKFTNKELQQIVDYMQAEIDEDKYLPFSVAFLDQEEIEKKRADSLPEYRKLMKRLRAKAVS